jgi:hypothetical protein
VGVFDLPAPLYAWLDVQASALPPAARLAAWGVLAGLVSMGLYSLFSAQPRIRRGKQEIRQAQQALDAYDGELAGGWPLIRRLLSLALGQVGRVTGPTLLASLPLLSLLAWLSTTYGHQYPAPETAPEIHTTPPYLNAVWVDDRQDDAPYLQPPRVVITDPSRRVVADVMLHSPVSVIHKRQWWNLLIGNPLGYLPGDAPVERIRVELPRRTYLSFGPQWARGWEFGFFLPLVAASLALKIGARIA